MMGTRHRIAISCARNTLRTVSGYHEPAFTVASLATTAASRPAMLSFFFNDPATTEIYTLSLHDALPIYVLAKAQPGKLSFASPGVGTPQHIDRKSTRLNSSHMSISYAVFCLKKKKK